MRSLHAPSVASSAGPSCCRHRHALSHARSRTPPSCASLIPSAARSLLLHRHTQGRPAILGRPGGRASHRGKAGRAGGDLQACGAVRWGRRGAAGSACRARARVCRVCACIACVSRMLLVRCAVPAARAAVCSRAACATRRTTMGCARAHPRTLSPAHPRMRTHLARARCVSPASARTNCTPTPAHHPHTPTGRTHCTPPPSHAPPPGFFEPCEYLRAAAASGRKLGAGVGGAARL